MKKRNDKKVLIYAIIIILVVIIIAFIFLSFKDIRFSAQQTLTAQQQACVFDTTKELSKFSSSTGANVEREDYISITKAAKELCQNGVQEVFFGSPLNSCPADLDEDTNVGPSDLSLLLGSWGECGPSPPSPTCESGYLYQTILPIDIAPERRLVIDNSDVAHIVYAGYNAPDFNNVKLKYLSVIPNNLPSTPTTIDSIPSSSCQISIATDSENGIYAVYWDIGVSGSSVLKLAYKPQGGSWTTQEIGPTQAAGVLNTCSEHNLYVDNNGAVHVSYTYEPSGASASDLKYAYKPQGGTWTFENVDAISSTTPRANALVVDNLFKVHAVYINNHPSLGIREVRYAYRSSPGVWNTEVLDPLSVSEGAPKNIELEIDTQQNLHAMYSTRIVSTAPPLNGVGLVYAQKTPTGQWTKNMIFQNGHSPRIALDNGNNLHIVFKTTELSEPVSTYYSYKTPNGNFLFDFISAPDGGGIIDADSYGGPFIAMFKAGSPYDVHRLIYRCP